MAKPKVEGETKREKFKRIASSRTEQILHYLDLLGNCSRDKDYEYEDEDVKKIFDAIEKKTTEAKDLFLKKRSKTGFSLD